jgi:putative hydrolases of HD superfamily
VSEPMEDLIAPLDPASDPIEGMLTVARFALTFGEVKRTAVKHADGVTPESDAEHTVMLAWIAPAVAARFFPELNPHLVTSFAVVHDMVEVFAGDTPTIRITAAQRRAKAKREADGVDRLYTALSVTMPWLPEMVLRYEAQSHPAARFVKALDKLMPKLVHLVDQGAGLREHRVTRREFVDMASAQREIMAGYVSDFPALFELHLALCDRVLDGVEFHPEEVSDHG